MSRMDFNGLQGWALAGIMLCGPVQAESDSGPLNPQGLIDVAPHGIQLGWREIHRIQQARKPDGSCDFKQAQRILREQRACILRIEIARDPASCVSIIERGEPVNRNRCRVDGFYAHYTPGTQESAMMGDRLARNPDNGAYIDMLISAFAGVFIAPTFYTLVARSTMNPQTAITMEDLEGQTEVSPPYREPATRQVADSIKIESPAVGPESAIVGNPGES